MFPNSFISSIHLSFLNWHCLWKRAVTAHLVSHYYDFSENSFLSRSDGVRFDGVLISICIISILGIRGSCIVRVDQVNRSPKCSVRRATRYCSQWITQESDYLITSPISGFQGPVLPTCLQTFRRFPITAVLSTYLNKPSKNSLWSFPRLKVG